jgi:very-short-patch-repair endonuclease
MSASTIDRRISTGMWLILHEGVYRLASVAESWEQSLTAALLWASQDAAISHRSAARLWEMEGLEPAPLELSTVRNLRRSGLIVHRVKQLSPHLVTNLKGFRVTTPDKTLLDLGTVLSIDRVEQALEDALRRRLTSLPRLRWLVRNSPNARGITALRSLLDLRPKGWRPTDSALEVEMLQLLRAAGLPKPDVQCPILYGRRVVARADFAYPQAKLVIEVEGYRYHSGREAWTSDLARRNLLARLGWRILHVTYDDLRARPGEICVDIARMIATG